MIHACHRFLLGWAKMGKAQFEVFCIYWSADMKRSKTSLLAAACAQPQLPDDKMFAKCFQRGSFPFPLFWRPDKNAEAGWVCVYACPVWLTILIAFLRGWMNIKAFQIFKFWNNCERDLRAELRTCISAWHYPAYSLVECLILLLQCCLSIYFLKHSVTLVKWNIKIVFTLLH